MEGGRQLALPFASDGEAAVGDGIERFAVSMPAGYGLSYAVNVPVNVGPYVFRPDVTIICGGRAGGIEVDGPHHRGRWVADRSRDEILLDHGFASVYRIPVEDTNDPESVDAHLQRFMRRLMHSPRAVA